MTTGRSGSTSFLDALANLKDVFLPNDLFPCWDQELTHPHRVKKHIEWFRLRSGKPVKGQDDLVEQFYQLSVNRRFIGYKSMPSRHNTFKTFTRRADIQFITLVREDLPSTLASFYMARRNSKDWTRRGEPQKRYWTFSQSDIPGVLGNLEYLLNSHRMIESIPHAIRLSYEDLCSNDFRSEELDGFFEYPVRLSNPQPPVSASTYVTNWAEFVAFVESSVQKHDQEGSKDCLEKLVPND
jgi:hypothetical protein